MKMMAEGHLCAVLEKNSAELDGRGACEWHGAGEPQAERKR